MEVPGFDRGPSRRPLFAGGIAMAVAFPCAMVVLAMGEFVFAVPILLSPVGFMRYFQMEEEDVHQKFRHAWVREGEIEVEDLPTHVSASGLVLKDVVQGPGRVIYEGGVFRFTPGLGKEFVIALEDISEYEISPWFNGSVRPGQYGVMLTVSGMWRAGFTVSALEPWRSLLEYRGEVVRGLAEV